MSGKPVLTQHHFPMRPVRLGTAGLTEGCPGPWLYAIAACGLCLSLVLASQDTAPSSASHHARRRTYMARNCYESRRGSSREAGNALAHGMLQAHWALDHSCRIRARSHDGRRTGGCLAARSHDGNRLNKAPRRRSRVTFPGTPNANESHADMSFVIAAHFGTSKDRCCCGPVMMCPWNATWRISVVKNVPWLSA
jgi:hypothetical protein